MAVQFPPSYQEQLYHILTCTTEPALSLSLEEQRLLREIITQLTSLLSESSPNPSIQTTRGLKRSRPDS